MSPAATGAGRVAAVVVDYRAADAARATRPVAARRAGRRGRRRRQRLRRRDAAEALADADLPVPWRRHREQPRLRRRRQPRRRGPRSRGTATRSCSSSATPTSPSPRRGRALVAALDADRPGPSSVRDPDRGATLPVGAGRSRRWSTRPGMRSSAVFWPDNPFTRRYRPMDGGGGGTGEADWVSGSCFLTRRSALTSWAGSTSRYFMFAEDMDLCWRAKQAGWVVGVQPAAVVTHAEGVSRSRHPYRMVVAHHRSALRFANRTTTGWRHVRPSRRRRSSRRPVRDGLRQRHAAPLTDRVSVSADDRPQGRQRRRTEALRCLPPSPVGGRPVLRSGRGGGTAANRLPGRRPQRSHVRTVVGRSARPG